MKNEHKSQYIDSTINHWMIKSTGIGETPQSLWEAACQYFTWCEANPIFKNEVVKQTGQTTAICVPRPFNIAALCIHLGVSHGWLKSIYKNESVGEYHMVVQRIMQVIYAQKFEYAMVGIYNPVMAGKDLRLGDETGDGKVPSQINISVLSNGGKLLRNEQEFDIRKEIKPKDEENVA